MTDTRDWDQQLIEEQEALEADSTVKEVAIILLTRDVTGTPWLDWDVWDEQASDDDRLDALRTASAVVEHVHEHGRPAGVEFRCTCPSGDGSLRWPCPAHPPVKQEAHEGHQIIEIPTYASSLIRRRCATCDVELDPRKATDA